MMGIIYAVSTLFSISSYSIFYKAMKDKMIMEGYEFVNNEKILLERIENFIRDYYKLLVPGYNILFVIIMLYEGFDKVYNNSIVKGLLNGRIKIRKFNEEENNLNDDESEKVFFTKSYESLVAEAKIKVLTEERKKMMDQLFVGQIQYDENDNLIYKRKR